MTPAVANLALARGTAYDVVLVIQDAASQPIDLTGCTLTASIISAASGAAAVDLAVAVTDAAAGLATVHIPVQPLGMAGWELWMQAAPETPRERVLRGLVTVSERVDPRDEGNPSSHRLIVRVSDAVTVSIDSVDLAWWAYEQTRKLLGVDYAALCADAARTAQQAESAAHTSSADAATYAAEAMRHKDAAVLSSTGAAASERNADASAQAAAESARTASNAQGAAAQDAQELRLLLDGFVLTPGKVDALPYGNSPSVSIDPGPTPGSHVLNFVLMSGPQGPKGDPGVLTANAGDLDLGGRLTAMGGTFAETVNANSGINIPLAVSPTTDTAAVNRLYALGLAQVATAHHVRNYWRTDQCTATNGATINHVAPGCYLEVNVSANTHTSLTLPVVGCNGAGNYGSICGVSLPLVITDHNSGWDKTTVIIGAGGQWVEHLDADVDGYRMAPLVGTNSGMARVIEVTRWVARANNGYRMRVREIVRLGNPADYKVRTTESSVVYDYNTKPPHAMYRLVIAQRNHTWGSQAINAGVWMIIGGLSSDSVIKLADLSGWDTIGISGITPIRLDVRAIGGGVGVRAESPTMLRWANGRSCMPEALEALAKSWIVSVTEEPFVDPDQQPTT